MGIQGLLPGLKGIERPIHVADLHPSGVKDSVKSSSVRVGIDGYCWLHRGAFSCAWELSQNKPTRKYVDFCMHRIKMLIFNGITPIVVFDGAPLPAKRGQEEQRRHRREENRERGIKFLRSGEKDLALDCFQKCIDITPQMALEFIKDLRNCGVQYIVAPYEADAQLAFLSLNNHVDAVITEDSDLLVFGCKRVVLKMDKYGNGTDIKHEDLGKATDLNLQGWALNEVRQMCILSGCDYLESLPGMGLKTANKLLRKHKTVEKVVHFLKTEGGKDVPPDYLKKFRLAELTFQHQRVYDPDKERLVPLTPFSDDVSLEERDFVGPDLDPKLARQIALGNVDPFTLAVLDHYDPASHKSAPITSNQLSRFHHNPQYSPPKKVAMIHSFFKPAPKALETAITGVATSPTFLKKDPKPIPAPKRSLSDPFEMNSIVSQYNPEAFEPGEEAPEQDQKRQKISDENRSAVLSALKQSVSNLKKVETLHTANTLLTTKLPKAPWATSSPVSISQKSPFFAGGSHDTPPSPSDDPPGSLESFHESSEYSPEESPQDLSWRSSAETPTDHMTSSNSPYPRQQKSLAPTPPPSLSRSLSSPDAASKWSSSYRFPRTETPQSSPLISRSSATSQTTLSFSPTTNPLNLNSFAYTGARSTSPTKASAPDATRQVRPPTFGGTPPMKKKQVSLFNVSKFSNTK